jgi:hypothetical protein
MAKVADEQTRPKGNPRFDYEQANQAHARGKTEAAPDGFRSCGTQPANISLIRRRSKFCVARRLGHPNRINGGEEARTTAIH